MRSELAIPMLLKDRCIGVFDLESPELDAFTKRDVEILTLLASQAAVAIENARLYEAVSANEARMEKELHFAKRVQAALLPTQLPKRLKGVDVAAEFALGARAGRRFSRLSRPRIPHAHRRARRRVGKGRAGRALQRICERARARPHVPAAISAGEVVARRRAVVDQHDPARAAARVVLLHALLCALRSQAAHGDDRQLRACRIRSMPGRRASSLIELPGVPLGSFFGITYDEVSLPLEAGDVFVFDVRRRDRGDERQPARSSPPSASSRSVKATRHAVPPAKSSRPSSRRLAYPPRRLPAERRHDWSWSTH